MSGKKIAQHKLINLSHLLQERQAGHQPVRVAVNGCGKFATIYPTQASGLTFPPSSRFSLADVCKPEQDGGALTGSGTTEVVSSLKRSGEPDDHHLAIWTFVVVKPGTDYAQQCFREYHMLPDESGFYGALYRPTHMIGLELGLSVASVALRSEPTGRPYCFSSDVVAVAKRDLRASERLDGEGGHCVYGQQMPASLSVSENVLPLDVSGGVTLLHDVSAGQVLCEADTALDNSDDAVKARRMMISGFTS